jgi:hypothetical protein
VRGILYSAPSRLISHRMKVRVYADHLDCYLSGALVHSAARGSHAANSSRRELDYRHFIEALKRKPQAFKGLAFRDDLWLQLYMRPVTPNRRTLTGRRHRSAQMEDH